MRNYLVDREKVHRRRTGRRADDDRGDDRHRATYPGRPQSPITPGYEFVSAAETLVGAAEKRHIGAGTWRSRHRWYYGARGSRASPAVRHEIHPDELRLLGGHQRRIPHQQRNHLNPSTFRPELARPPKVRRAITIPHQARDARLQGRWDMSSGGSQNLARRSQLTLPKSPPSRSACSGVWFHSLRLGS